MEYIVLKYQMLIYTIKVFNKTLISWYNQYKMQVPSFQRISIIPFLIWVDYYDLNLGRHSNIYAQYIAVS